MFFLFFGVFVLGVFSFLVFVFGGGFQKHDVSWVWSVRPILAAGDQLEVRGREVHAALCAHTLCLSPFRFGSLLM